MGKKTKKAKIKGKKKKTARPGSKKWTKYKIEGGEVKAMQRTCPKCGPGVFMANHPGRFHCGRCGYTDFTRAEKK